MALAIGYKFGGYLSNRLSPTHLMAFYVGSGAISASWMNFAFFTYPYVVSHVSNWGIVSGSIFSCLYLLFIPLVIFWSLNPALVSILSNRRKDSDNQRDHYAGNVFFISTIGSVAGVFVAAYLILPNISNFLAYSLFSFGSSMLSFILIFLLSIFLSWLEFI